MKTIKPKFKDFSEIINIEDIGAKYSRYGNTYTILTKKHIDALAEGKVIFIAGGVHGHFIIASDEPVTVESEDKLQ